MTATFYAWDDAIEGYRFIVLTPDDPVVETSSSGRTDEGWSSSYTTWTLDPDAGVVRRAWGSDGVDCDGRLSQHGVDVCPLDHLQAVIPYGWQDNPEAAPFRLPEWQDGERSQRDYSAEAAGY